MYRYDEFDHAFVQERVAQFRDQVGRRLSGELDEDQFKPLRLKNGVYLQLHAYMLRIAVPYGTLNPRQVRQLAYIARNYDKGYGHFTTRQNLQFNWPQLEDVPDILAKLAEVEMHCIQTSGNCIRNVTADHFAGVSADEVADPRPYAEILRQWSSLHPEFLFLPRKFKIAVTGAPVDRAAIQFHDIGYEVKRNAEGRARLRRLYRRRHGPHADARQEDPRLPAGRGPARLFRGDPARLQHARPPRQQVQGAHQDPRPRDRHGGDRARRSRPSSRRTATACCACPRTRSAASPPISRRRPMRSGPPRAPSLERARLADPDLRPLGAPQCEPPPRAGLRHRHHLAEADRRRAGRRDRPPDGSASPISPSAIRSTRCASATSRTSSCRTSRSTT